MTASALLLFAAAAHLIPLDQAKFREVVASHRGQVLLVDFWATWCEPCREELPKLEGLERRLKPAGFVLITVSADEPEQAPDALTVLAKNRIAPPFYVKRVEDNERFIDFFDPKWSGALPALFLYDRLGRKVRFFVGDANLTDVESAVRGVLKGADR